ncbi:MAG: hypothetical protein F7C35_06625 [Desulfurococcales archaeon]|nr:hypothetical protein [Desulfurococcales archaeon]
MRLDPCTYRRVHLLPDPGSFNEAAAFLSSSLLLSHSIRRDTLAIVVLKRGVIAAPGDHVRQLRPDLESSTGWLRAVLRGKWKGLGAVMMEHPFNVGAWCGRVIQTFMGVAGVVGEIMVDQPLLIVHTNNGVELGSTAEIRAPCPPPCRAAISNIILDRAEAGLPPV